MDIVELARDLGKKIQEDERFIAMRVASQQCDADETLQNMIGELTSSAWRSTTKRRRKTAARTSSVSTTTSCARSMPRSCRTRTWRPYTAAKNELDALVQRVTTVITMSADGEDPDTCDCESCGCSGNCSSCGGGCH